MRIIYTLIFTILLSALHAQDSFLKYYDFKSEYGNIHGLCRVGDELVGTGIFWDTFISPNKLNIVVYKNDLNGESVDYQYYRDVDSSAYNRITIEALYFPNLITLSDSSFVFCFYNLKKSYLEIFKFDNQFNLLCKNKITAYDSTRSVSPSRILLLNDNIYLSGFEKVSTNGYKSHLFKFDLNLNLIWKKEIPDMEVVRSFEYNKENNEFIFSEYAQYDRIIITDTLLNKKITIFKEVSRKEVISLTIRSLNNKDFLLSNSDIFGDDIFGYSFSKNISKVNEDFNTMWTFSMGGLPDKGIAIVDIIPSSDNAYFAYGQVGARVADIRDIYAADSIDIMMLSTVKFKDDGKILWHRFDTLATGYYAASYAHCGGMVAADDGGLYISGRIDYYDTIRINGALKLKTLYKPFLMKIDSSGCVEGLHCNVEPKTETVLSATPGIAAADERLRIYPNPGTGRITVTRDEHTRSGLLTVYDAHGVPLISKKIAPGSEEIQLDLSGQPSGRYYVTLRGDGGKVIRSSFMIIR